MSLIEFKSFTPSKEFAKAANVKKVTWCYELGKTLVKEYGAKFKESLIPDCHYLLVGIGDDLDVLDFDQYLNILDFNTASTNYRDLVIESFATRRWSKKYNGTVAELHGHKVIMLFLFGHRFYGVFDLDTQTMHLIPTHLFLDIADAKECYDESNEFFGDLSDIFPDEKVPEWKELDVHPSNEIATNGRCEYLIAYGWQLLQHYPDIGLVKILRSTRYCIFRITMPSGKSRISVVVDKWRNVREAESKSWMREEGSYTSMLRDASFNSSPTVCNGEKIILCYPFQVYHPVLWVTDTDELFVLPSRIYDDEYCLDLGTRFGVDWWQEETA